MDTKNRAAILVGAFVLVVFIGFTFYLAGNIAVAPDQWERLVYVFGGVEGLAFAAAGYFFGKEVHREQATLAENRARLTENKSRDDLRMGEHEATKFTSLVTYIDTHSPKSNLAQADDQWTALANFAKSLQGE